MRYFISLLLTLNIGFGFAQNTISPNTIEASSKSLNVYTENGRMGLRKNTRKYITAALYDTLYQHNAAVYIGKRYNATKQTAFWGVIDGNGQVLLPFRYLTLRVDNEFFIVGHAENNKILYGAYDFAGIELVSPKYTSIKVHDAGLIEGRTNNKSILFNIRGEKQAEFSADSVAMLSKEIIKVYKHGKAGAMGFDNTAILPVQYRNIAIIDSTLQVEAFPQWHIIQGFDSIAFHYDNIRSWNDNFIATSGTKNIIIDRNSEVYSEAYDAIITLNQKLALVRNDFNWGVINNAGAKIIEPIYAEILADNEILAAKAHGQQAKWTIFDLYGFPKTKLVYSNVRSIKEGRIPIERNGKWGFLDRFGIEIIAPIFDAVSDFSHGRASVLFFGESGIIDRSGNWILTPGKNRILDYNDKVIIAKNGANYEVIDYTNELIYFTENKLEISREGLVEYDSAGQVLRTISWQGTLTSDISQGQRLMTGGNGYYIFENNGRFGFKDYQGRVRIANQYELVKPFHQEYAAVKINNKWGFINLDETIVVQPLFDSVGYFSDSNCITVRGGKFGVIDASGKVVINNTYQEIIRLSNGSFRVRENNNWGVLSKTGAFIIHPRYNSLTDTQQGYFIVEKNGKYGTIDYIGVSRVPLLYDYIGYEQQSKTLLTKIANKTKWTSIQKVHFTQ